MESIATYSNDDTRFAESIFTHYFELAVFKEYVEIIRTFINDLGLTSEESDYIEIISELKGLLQLNCPLCDTIKDIEDLLSFVVEQINYMGVTPEQARSILPNSLKTEIVVTMNLREWRHFFKLRISKRAHPQMREISMPLLSEFKKILPVIFEDIEPE